MLPSPAYKSERAALSFATRSRSTSRESLTAGPSGACHATVSFGHLPLLGPVCRVRRVEDRHHPWERIGYIRMRLRQQAIEPCLRSGSPVVTMSAPCPLAPSMTRFGPAPSAPRHALMKPARCGLRQAATTQAGCRWWCLTVMSRPWPRIGLSDRCSLVGALASYRRQLPAPPAAIDLQHGLLLHRGELV